MPDSQGDQFWIIYGMSAWGLSEAINISQSEANVYINKYFENFSKVKTYLDGIIEEAKEKGYTDHPEPSPLYPRD